MIDKIRWLQKEEFTRVNSVDEPFRITERHIRSLHHLNEKMQLKLVQMIFERQFTVSKSEKYEGQLCPNSSIPKTSKKPAQKLEQSDLGESPEGTIVTVSHKELVIRIQHGKNQNLFLERFEIVSDWLRKNEILSAYLKKMNRWKYFTRVISSNS